MGTPKDFFGGGKMENRQKNRQIYISLARVLCAFAVVTIHANDCFKEFNIEGCWGIANAIETGLFFAVPVFMMITGATLMDYSERYSTKEYFIKRIQKDSNPIFCLVCHQCYFECEYVFSILLFYKSVWCIFMYSIVFIY